MTLGAGLRRVAAWIVCVVAAAISGLAFLIAVLTVGYEHGGSSPWPSEWAAVGTLLLAGVGPVAAGLGLQQLLKRRPGLALGLAALALAASVGWYFVWVALWS